MLDDEDRVRLQQLLRLQEQLASQHLLIEAQERRLGQLQAELQKRQGQLDRLTAELAHLQLTSDTKIAASQRSDQALREQVAGLEAELGRIHASKGWRAVLLMRRWLRR